jgi:hypothetical protein
MEYGVLLKTGIKMKLVKTILCVSLLSMVSSYSYAGGPLSTSKITSVAFNTGGFFYQPQTGQTPTNALNPMRLCLKQAIKIMTKPMLYY